MAERLVEAAISRHPYRSGLRFWPPLAIGGHGWQQVVDGQEDGGGLLQALEKPAIHQCGLCYELRPSWAIREGFYSKPCLGRVAALPPGPPVPPSGWDSWLVENPEPAV